MDLTSRIKALIKLSLEEGKVKERELQVYAYTNENIAGYLDKLELKSDMKAMSICSSGDHLFNLGTKGITNVDLIDVNPLTEYYVLGLRRALIRAYSYQDYMEVIKLLFKCHNWSLESEKKILYGILKFMSFPYQVFFKEIFDYYFALQEKLKVKVTLMQILTTDYYFDSDEITYYNLYMQSNSNYETLRSNLQKMNLNFVSGDIFGVSKTHEYDLILCSNALEHTFIPDCDIRKLKEKCHGLYGSLKDDGTLLATYIYGFYNNTSGEYRVRPIGGTDITARELLKEELIEIPGYYRENKDAVLVLRK